MKSLTTFGQGSFVRYGRFEGPPEALTFDEYHSIWDDLTDVHDVSAKTGRPHRDVSGGLDVRSGGSFRGITMLDNIVCKQMDDANPTLPEKRAKRAVCGACQVLESNLTLWGRDF